MSKVCALIFSFWLSWCWVSAQAIEDFFTSPAYNSSTLRATRYDDSTSSVIPLIGNRYLGNENFQTGEIWTTNGHYKNELTYRYDQLEGTIEIKFQNGKQVLLPEKDIIMCHINYENNPTIFVRSKLLKSKKPVLLQMVFYSPNLQLLRYSKKSIYSTTGLHKEVYHYTWQNVAEIRNTYRYFITKGEKFPLNEIDITEKSLCNAFPSKCSKIAQFFSKHNSKENLTLSKVVELMKRLDASLEQ